MKHKPGRKFIQNDYKSFFKILGILAAIIVILVAVVMLLTGNHKNRGLVDRDGLSTSSVFPYAYIDELQMLKVATGEKGTDIIDNNASSPILDAAKDNIYYLKENTLYLYSIKDKTRRILVKDEVAGFKLLPNRAAIVYASVRGDLHMYNCSTGEDESFTERNRLSDIELMVKIGRTGFIYLDNINRDKNTGTLYSRRDNGTTYKISDNVQIGTMNVSKRENYISYESKNGLFITDFKGNPVASAQTAREIADTDQSVFADTLTKESEFNEGIEMSYAIQQGKILFFNGDEFVTVAEEFEEIVFYSKEYKRIIYTTTKDGAAFDVMMAAGDGKAVKIAEVLGKNTFTWSESTEKLYCLYKKQLTEIDVRNDNAAVEIAKDVEFVGTYPGKPYVVYTDSHKADFYIISSTETSKLEAGTVRLYGRSDKNYLLMSIYKAGEEEYTSLDFVKGDLIQLISPNVVEVLAFDYEFNNILYREGENLVLRKGDNVFELDTVHQITPVEIKR